jgi:predicted ArsR family transcriptional regulator
VAALQHPTRNRLLLAIGGEGATVSQLAAKLHLNKGNVAHHLAVLERVGLARGDRTRTVRGGTERYWVRTTPRLRSPGGVRGHTHAMLAAVADEIDDARGTPLLHLRHLRLSPQAARELATHLDRLVTDLPSAAAHAPTFGVLVAVYDG